MTCLSCVLLSSLGLLVLFKVYLKLTSKWCTSKVCLVGKTIIVTGSNTGIGYESALEFAKRGARVILACRDETKATEARDKIIRETENKNVVVKLLDLSSLKSVRNFAKSILETEERLDVLVNNAATGSVEGPSGTLSEDGLSFLMQVNYFGHVLLTVLLIGLLKKSAPSRIVNVSSQAGNFGKVDVDKVAEPSGGRLTAYANSKLANILFTIHLAKLLEKTNVSVYSLHPGAVDTEFLRYIESYIKYIIEPIKKLFFKTSEEGAQTTIYTAIEQNIETYSGRHFEECHVVKNYKTAADADLPKKLWDKTVELLKLEKEVKNL